MPDSAEASAETIDHARSQAIPLRQGAFVKHPATEGAPTIQGLPADPDETVHFMTFKPVLLQPPSPRAVPAKPARTDPAPDAGPHDPVTYPYSHPDIVTFSDVR
jgi:hypothetical protein